MESGSRGAQNETLAIPKLIRVSFLKAVASRCDEIGRTHLVTPMHIYIYIYKYVYIYI